MRSISFLRCLLAALTLVAVAAGCGGSDKKESSPAATTTTTNATDSTATVASTAASGTTVPAGTNTNSPWNADAQQYRGKTGEKFTIDCPPGGEQFPVWGVETYTDDSSVCNAGVHVGLITFDKGGSVVIEIQAGEDSFDAGVANGVTSLRYGRWEGSFIFPEAPPGSGTSTFAPSPASWSRTATEYRDKANEQVTVVCSAGGTLGSVWGTGTYTADSSICTAAVHSGVFTQANGGSVTIVIKPGEDSYKGSTANGVTSSDYAKFGSSFAIKNEPPED